MGQVFKSPAYFVLLALGLFNAAGSLWFATDDTSYGGSIYPLTRMLLNPLIGSFTLIPVIIAIYYAGELVWRERDRKTHEIIDSTPVADWAFVAPKVAAIALVLISTLLVSVLAAVISQAAHGYFGFEFDKYLLWYLAPMSVSLVLTAVLAVFLQVLSPHKSRRLGPDGVLHRGRHDLLEPRLRAPPLQLWRRRPGRADGPDVGHQPPGQVLDRRLVGAALLERLRRRTGGAGLRPLATRDRDPPVAPPATSALSA